VFKTPTKAVWKEVMLALERRGHETKGVEKKKSRGILTPTPRTAHVPLREEKVVRKARLGKIRLARKGLTHVTGTIPAASIHAWGRRKRREKRAKTLRLKKKRVFRQKKRGNAARAIARGVENSRANMKKDQGGV